MSEDPLVKAKVGLTEKGGELEVAVGSQVPSYFAKLFPTSALRSQARREITASLLEKVRNGQALDEADTEYLAGILKPAEARWINQKAISQRAIAILEAEPVRLALPAHTTDSSTPQSSPTMTADDWFAKFWDDAGLVSDDLLREIYARILVAESTKSTSCSLRTLRAIRYLDRETADLFAKAAPLVLNNELIPRDDQLLESRGLEFPSILELIDADLIQGNTLLEWAHRDTTSYYEWGSKTLRIKHADRFTIPAYALTRAGCELARIAMVERDAEYFKNLMGWLKKIPGCTDISWAERHGDTELPLRDQQEWVPFNP